MNETFLNVLHVATHEINFNNTDNNITVDDNFNVTQEELEQGKDISELYKGGAKLKLVLQLVLAEKGT